MNNDGIALLIIGNGFDLNCKLNSKFSDFFEKRCVKIFDEFYHLLKMRNDPIAMQFYKNHNDIINFWSFIMYVQFYSSDDSYKNKNDFKKNWCDIEFLIKLVLLNDFFGNNSILKYFEIFLSFYNSTRPLYELNNVIINPYIAYFWVTIDSEMNFYDYLLVELHKFEISFKNYLIALINEDYYKQSDKLVERIISNNHKVIDVLNFNYTEINDKPYINEQINIHGKLFNDEIIIGIDSNEINDDKLYKFTKTYRNMKRLRDVIKLSENIDYICFYGHSLADADFSYFYSIFDMYDLYNGKLVLKFLYSDYEEDDATNEENHNEYVSRIYNLINRYSKFAHNENNLLHRMLLEGRIIIEKL